MVSFLNKSRGGFDLLSGIEGNLDDPTPSSAQEAALRVLPRALGVNSRLEAVAAVRQGGGS